MKGASAMILFSLAAATNLGKWRRGTRQLQGEGQFCLGFDESTGRPFGECAAGLECEEIFAVGIPGTGSRCVIVPAEEGETCLGFDETTGRPFAPCDTGLACKPIGGMITFPGAGNECAYAQEGEPCESFDETTGEHFAECDDALRCERTAEASIFGGRTCVAF